MAERTYFTVDELRGLPLVTGDQIDAALAACDRIDAALERQRLCRICVAPDRVIDGETVQPARKEIEG